MKMRSFQAGILFLLLTQLAACGDQVVGWPAADRTAPTVSSTTPVNTATSVALNALVSATFSEVMDHQTISTATFTVNDGTTPLTGTVMYIGVTAIFTPSNGLDPNTLYTATIDQGVTDLAGNEMAGDYTWSFTTGTFPDNTPPRVSSTTPADDAEDVALNALISATFSEAMDPSTISTATFRLLDGERSVPGIVIYVGVTAIFTPRGILLPDTQYTARILDAAADLAGNSLAEDYEWSFTTGAFPDTTPPRVSSTTPAHRATSVALNAPISATFSEAMDPLTISTATFTLLDGTTPVSGSVRYIGVTALFTPTAILDANTSYTATISDGAADLAGNTLASDYVWIFRTGEAADTTPPRVSSTIPANGATEVPFNALISATFSEVMDPHTISTATFTLLDGTTPVPGAVTYVGITATFNPTDSLDPDTQYTATITDDATDLAGNALAADYVWIFTTGAAPDTIPPRVTWTTPDHGATEVALNAPISATFSEAMDPLTISTVTFTLYDGATPVLGTVMYVGVTAIFTPADVLDGDTLYVATIENGVTDLAGNAMVNDYVWSFRTGEAEDTTPPRVSWTTPANGATEVALNTMITATFSEAMNPLTISAVTFTLLDGPTPVPGAVSYIGVTATFDPAGNLDANTTYTATVLDDAADLAGNPLAADYVWTFTTGPGSDTQRPRVTFTVPADDATGVPIGSNILAVFSEPMDPATITAANFTVQQLATPVAGTVTYTNLTATFNPTGPLAANTTYSATITTAAKDLAGNSLALNFVWNFKTGATPDTTRPWVTFTIPDDEEEAVVLNSNVSATFNEAMNPLTLTAATFTLEDGTALIEGAVTPIGANAIFNPTDDLDPDTEYTATITNEATDLAGNTLAADYVWTFTTASTVDSDAPWVVMTTPEDDDIDVPIDATVNATFSEAMDPLTISLATFEVVGPGTAEVTGSVLYDVLNQIGTFTPDSDLLEDTTYTATITTGATDLAGIALEDDYVWSFETGGTSSGLPAINLGSASTFGSFGGSAGVTNSGILTVVNGDIGTIAASTLVTGFHDTAPGCIYTETTLNEGFVNGLIYTAPPPPSVACPGEGTAVTFAIAAQARLDAEVAYNELVALPGGPDPGAGSLAGLVLPPGVYTAALGSFLIQGGDLTLDAQGDANAVWVFQMATTLTVGGPGADFPQSVILINGAQSKNVFWQVGSAATINAGGGGTMEGTIISMAGAAFSTAGNVDIVTLNGRAISLVASVTLVNTVINVPAP